MIMSLRDDVSPRSNPLLQEESASQSALAMTCKRVVGVPPGMTSLRRLQSATGEELRLSPLGVTAEFLDKAFK